MTIRKYYDDSKTTSFSSRVVEETSYENNPAIILETTYFYPTGGGQPHDTGTINNIEVLNVITRDSDLAVLHVLAEPLNADNAECVINKSRRLDHMQQHTGQHILTQAFVQIAGAHTVAFHLGNESVTIDLDKLNLPNETIITVEDLANQIIFENRPVTPRLINPGDLEGVRMRRMPEHMATKGLRVVDIEDFDLTACGGTHVEHTGEIGLLKIVKLEKHGDTTRVEFRCGGRALADYRIKNDLAYQLTSLTNVGIPELPDATQRMQEQIKVSQRQIKALTNQLMDYEANNLIATASEQHGIKIVKRIFEDADMETMRIFASKATQQDSVIVLCGLPGERCQLILARSQNVDLNLNPILQQALQALGDGRGGGRPDFVQGGGIKANTEQLSKALEVADQALFRT